MVQVTESADGVRLLTLNDPDRRNAMSPALLAGLAEAVNDVASDRSARVLVVAANGPAFSAGADLPALFGDSRRPVPQIRDQLRGVYAALLHVRDLAIPTIAAVQGPAVGAGVNLAMACDVRIAGPEARLGISFIRLGLHPGGGCTSFLTKTLGRQRTLSLILDGGTLSADEARSLGLVLEVVDDPLSAALDRAARWAEINHALVRDVKRAVSIAERGDFDAALDFESWAQAASVDNPLLAAAVEHFARPEARQR